MKFDLILLNFKKFVLYGFCECFIFVVLVFGLG